MNRKYRRPETEAPRRLAPTSEAADIHGTAPDRGDDLEHAPGLSDGQFHQWPPGTELPLARKEFEFGDRRCFREELVDALCRLRDAPGSADAYPNLSAYIELLREDTEPYFRTSAGRTDVEQLLDESPDDRDGMHLKSFRRQQAAARRWAQSDQSAGHSLRSIKLPTAWPGLMCEAMAAYYLGQIAVSTFRREVAAARIPQPVAISPRRKAWLKEELDAWLMSRRASANGLVALDEPRRRPAPRTKP